MAVLHFTGGAEEIGQTSTIDVDTNDAATTYTLSLGSQSISTIGQASANLTAVALQDAWNGSNHIYFDVVTAVAGGSLLTLTGNSVGMPFELVADTSGGGGAFSAITETIASQSGGHWDVASNWSTMAVPVDGDEVHLGNWGRSICWGMDQGAVTLSKFCHHTSFTGQIGLARNEFITSVDGETTDDSAPEYRLSYLTIGWDDAAFGVRTGPGEPAASIRIKVDQAKAGASTTVIHSTPSSSPDTNMPAMRMLAAHASADIYISGATGGFGVAVEYGETSTIGTLAIGTATIPPKVFTSGGVTLTNFEQASGNNILRSAGTVATVKVLGGTLRTEGDWQLTTLTNDGGNIFANHTNDGGNAVGRAFLNSGTTDLRQSRQPRTWKEVLRRPVANLLFDEDVVTMTDLTVLEEAT